jgi:hypothetical protein
MWKLIWAKLRRWIISGSGLLAMSAIVAVVLWLASKFTNPTIANSDDPGVNCINVPGWAALLIAAVFVLKTWIEYRKRTYDSSLIQKYQDRFDGKDMVGFRKKAIEAYKENRGHLSDIDNSKRKLSRIDDVLDFFDDLGFYADGDQMGYEVIHHHFYHWIRGYWILMHDYVVAWRGRQPKQWNNFEKMFNAIRTRECGVRFWDWKKEELFNANNPEAKFIKEELEP